MFKSIQKFFFVKKTIQKNLSGKYLPRKDFQGEHLEGYNFRGANLSHANFNNAYLQGADFTGATLKSTNFDNAKTGLQSYRKIMLVIILFTLAALLVALLVIIGQRMGDRLLYRDVSGIYPENQRSIIWNTANILIMLAVLLYNILQGKTLKKVFVWTSVTGVSSVGITLLDALIQVTNGSASLAYIFRPVSEATVGLIGVMGIGIIAVAIGLSIDIAEVVYGTKSRNLLKLGIFIIVIPVTLVTQSASGAGEDSLAVIIFVTLTGLFLGVSIAHQSSIRPITDNQSSTRPTTDNQSSIRPITVMLAAMLGTSFRDADLTDASFIEAKVKHADFRGAKTKRCSFTNDKKPELACFENIFRKPDGVIGGRQTGSPPLDKIRKRWAFIVGVNSYYDSSLPTLKSAVNDALELKKQLESVDYEVVCLHDGSEEGYIPTRKNVLEQLDKYCRSVEENDLLLVYFACHGKILDKDLQKEPYLVLKDTDSDNLEISGLALETVQICMKYSKAKRLLLILDACHMGVNTGRSIKTDQDFIHKVHELADGFALITASTAKQRADDEHSGGKNGVFTYYLLEALSGKADLDKQNLVTVQNLAKYVIFRVSNYIENNKQTGKIIQNPTFTMEGIGDFIVVDYRNSSQ